MRSKKIRFLLIILVAAFMFWSDIVEVKAQEFGRASINTVAKKPTGGGKVVRTKTVVVQQVRTVVKTVPTTKIVKVKTSNLIVTTQVKANVVIEQLNPAPKTKAHKAEKISVGQKSSDKIGSAEFEEIPPGKYRITASRDGYKTSVTEVEIEKEQTNGVPLNLEPFKYDLIIKTNISEGEVRYAPADFVSKLPDGTTKTIETGGYCIARIKNKIATVVGLEQGYYNIDIRPSDNLIEYDDIKAAINIPEELPDTIDIDVEIDGKIVKLNDALKFDIDLQTKISTETFSTSWTNAEWNLPNGWRLGNSLKTNRTAGIALPTNMQYRYYTNFEMVSDVASQDDNTVGFVFRAQDENNYYFLQIAGAKAPEPFVAKGFIVRNGQAQQIFSNPIPHFAKTIAARKSFRVIIRGKNNTFEVFIEDSSTADKLPVGNIIDRDNIFNKGAVGIGIANNSNFEVASFTVCPTICK
jgi:hypothetical protein